MAFEGVDACSCLASVFTLNDKIPWLKPGQWREQDSEDWKLLFLPRGI